MDGRRLARTLLNDVPGWGATVVHDAAAARAVASHLKVEVVVVDFHLAGISGLELLDLWPADPAAARPSAVLTTSAPPPPAVRAAIARGLVAAVVRKPFDVDELVAAVRRVAEARYGTA